MLLHPSALFFPNLSPPRTEAQSYRSRHPDELYKNGIQRESFVPCIELLKSHLDVTDLDSGTGAVLPRLRFYRRPHPPPAQTTGAYPGRSRTSTTPRSTTRRARRCASSSTR